MMEEKMYGIFNNNLGQINNNTQLQNETDIVENIHFQNPSSDINVKDAELTIDTGNRHLHVYCQVSA